MKIHSRTKSRFETKLKGRGGEEVHREEKAHNLSKG